MLLVSLQHILIFVLFNRGVFAVFTYLGESSIDITLDFSKHLGLGIGSKGLIRDVWKKQDFGMVYDQWTAKNVLPHQSVVVIFANVTKSLAAFKEHLMDEL